jgi:hypothetical protein
LLGDDAYINDGEGNPDRLIAAQIKSLKKLNEVVYHDLPKLRKSEPTSLEDVKTYYNTTITIKPLRRILTRTLDVVVPERVQEAMKEVLRNDRERHIKYLGRKGEIVDTNIKNITLQQMCAVLTRTEVNEHLRSVCKQRGVLELE